MPAARLGNRLRTAKDFGSLAAPISFRDALAQRDQDDAYGLIVVNPAPNTLPSSPYPVYVTGQTQGTLPNSGINNQGSFDAWAAQYSLSPV